MPARSFLDTNIIIYTDDHDEPDKQREALDLIERLRRERTGVVSVQVLQEYFAAATRKLGVPAGLARRKVELLAKFQVVIPAVVDVLAAIDLVRLHKISFWDAMILQAARKANCTTLYSEDLSSGSVIAGVRILDPFAA